MYRELEKRKVVGGIRIHFVEKDKKGRRLRAKHQTNQREYPLRDQIEIIEKYKNENFPLPLPSVLSSLS